MMTTKCLMALDGTTKHRANPFTRWLLVLPATHPAFRPLKSPHRYLRRPTPVPILHAAKDYTRNCEAALHHRAD